MEATKSDVDKIIQLVNDGNLSELKYEDFDQFQYQGFDPMKIAARLLTVKTEGKMDDVGFKKDVYTMVAVGMIKGSVNEQNIKKMSDTGQIELNNLIRKYGIKKGGGRSQPSDVITFPRVMATFPDVAVRMVQVIGCKEFRGGPMESARLPKQIQVQVFPATIPKNVDIDVRNMLLTASLCYSIDQTIQISNLRDPNLKEIAVTQMNFTQVGFNSPVPNATVRQTVFNLHNWAEDYDKISLVLNIYRARVDQSFIIMTKEQWTTKLARTI